MLHQVIEGEDWAHTQVNLAATTPAHSLRGLIALTSTDFEPVSGGQVSDKRNIPPERPALWHERRQHCVSSAERQVESATESRREVPQ